MSSKPELEPFVDFLGQHAPWSELSHTARAELAGQLEIEYRRRGSELCPPGSKLERLYIVRSGGLREVNAAGNLLADHGEGDTIGAEALAGREPRANLLRAIADTLLYTLSPERFARVCQAHPEVLAFFTQRAGESLRAASHAPHDAEPGSPNLSLRVGSLVTRAVVSVRANTSIRHAATLMTNERVSSLLVTGGPALGIMTDRDLRSRVIAEGRSADDPVASIMSSPVAGVDADAMLTDALMEMMNRGVHHLAVHRAGTVVGVLTVSDLVQSQATNPIYLLSDIGRQSSIAGLVQVSQQRADVLLQLVAAGAKAVDIQRILTRIGDALTRRCIALAQLELEKSGPPLPAQGFCWVAFGSQARQEHALGSDQDNGLILSESIAASDPRLSALAERVCDALAACGYPRCPGGIMAVTNRYRQPLSVWRAYFSEWIREPSRDAVMRGSIFFDLRAIAGDAALVTSLEEHVVEQVHERPLFIAHLARDALARRPPLGFFGRLVVEPGGEHSDTLDLKHRGVIPIVDLARVYALEGGCRGASTLERLRCARSRRTLSETGCEELVDALEVIGRSRLRHQARCLREARPVDNLARFEELSSVERRQLRDAFSVVKGLQDALEHSHQLGRISG